MVNNTYSEHWTIKCAGGLGGGIVHIAGLSATMTDVLVRVERDDGTTQVARLLPSTPSFSVEDAPHPLEVARTYLVLGIEHILGGIDHLLFVLALLLIVKGLRRVVATITAFTIAHSITLALATVGLLRLPGPPVEATIALSIVFVAAEIVRIAQGKPGITARWPWAVAFTFGLLHGLGFAGALSEIGVPQNAIPVALFFFNAGVEIGQLIFVGVFSILALLAARINIPRPYWARMAPAYAIGTIAVMWVLQRVAMFSTY